MKDQEVKEPIPPTKRIHKVNKIYITIQILIK